MFSPIGNTPSGWQPLKQDTTSASGDTPPGKLNIKFNRTQNSEGSSAAKAAARQRLEQLKNRLRMLQMFPPTGKGEARLVAQLARELAQAVRAYAAASGGGSAASISVSVSTEAASDKTEQADAQQEEAAAAEAAGDAAQADAQNRASTTTSEPIKSSGSGPNREDSEFLSEAKKIARQLKALMEHSRRKRSGGSGEVDDLKHALKALEDVDKSIREATEAISAGGADSQSVAYGADGGTVQVSVPTITVRA